MKNVYTLYIIAYVYIECLKQFWYALTNTLILVLLCVVVLEKRNVTSEKSIKKRLLEYDTAIKDSTPTSTPMKLRNQHLHDLFLETLSLINSCPDQN